MTAVMMPAQEIEQARTDLRAAVEALTTPKVVDIERDDGSRSSAVTPAPLESLAAEVGSQSAPSGSFAARSRPPLYVDAMCVLQAIDIVTSNRSPQRRCEAVHAWGYGVSSNCTGHQIVHAAQLASHWLSQVRELLNPTAKRRVRGTPCPHCGAAKVWDREDRDNDEHHARPALRVDEHMGGCVCDVCGAFWSVELFAHLQMVLEQNRVETLQAPGWDPTPSGGLHLPAVPVQCDGRVRDARHAGYRTRRCVEYLDDQGRCRNAERHEPMGEE